MGAFTLALMVWCVKGNMNMDVLMSNHRHKLDEIIFTNDTCSRLCVKHSNKSVGIRKCGQHRGQDQKDDEWSVCPSSVFNIGQKETEGTPSGPTGTLTTHKRQGPRQFLLVPFSYRQTQSYLYDPGTRSISPYPRLKTVGVSSLSYVISRNIVLFVCNNKLKYIKLNRDERRPRKVKNAPKMYSVAVDNLHDTIYFGEMKTSVCVGRMLPSLRNASMFYCLKGSTHFRAICLDEQSEIVYVGTNSALYKVPYAGQKHVRMYRTTFLRCLTFNSQTNQLIYVDRKKMTISSLSTHKIKRKNVRHTASDMAIHEKSLLIAYNTINKLDVFNFKKKKFFTRDIASPKPYTFYLCAIH